MSSLRFKQPCNDCPFRRASWPGWLGSGQPEWFVDCALSERPGDAPCHTTVDYESPDWRDGIQAGDFTVCAGALIFAANNCKLPRDPEQAALVQGVEADRSRVFATRQEFIDHHRQGTGSWEL